MTANPSRPTLVEVRTVTHTGGGPEKTILLGARWLEDRGWPVDVIYLHPPDDPGFATICNRAAELGLALREIVDRGPLDVRVVRELHHFCRQKGSIIWHGHDYKADFLGWLLRRFHPLVLVSTVHGWGVFGPRVRLYHFIHKLCLRGFDRIFCVSESLREECLRAGIAADICQVLENGVDCAFFHPWADRQHARATLGIPADQLVLGYVGRFSAEKNLPALLKAAAELLSRGHAVHVLLAGEGPERQALLQKAAQLGIAERVTFTGHVTDPRPAYAAMDVFVLPSLREGLPNALLEAMAMALPVVATQVGGIPGVVSSGINGLLVAPGDESALVAAVQSLLEDRSRAAALGHSARQHVQRHHSFEARMERLIASCEQLWAVRKTCR